MNSIHIISPYKYNGCWVFDDPVVGLNREAFVAGADTVLDMATAGIPKAERGFNLLFSDFPFPGHKLVLNKQGTNAWTDDEEIMFGTDYACEQLGIKCWLCPALNKYYPVSPDKIYADFQPIKGRIKKKGGRSEEKRKTNKKSDPEWRHVGGLC